VPYSLSLLGHQVSFAASFATRIDLQSKVGKSPSTAPTSAQQTVEINLDVQMSDLSLGKNDNTGSTDNNSDVSLARGPYM